MFLIYSLVKIGLTSSDLPLIKWHSLFTMTPLKYFYLVQYVQYSKNNKVLFLENRFYIYAFSTRDLGISCNRNN